MSCQSQGYIITGPLVLCFLHLFIPDRASERAHAHTHTSMDATGTTRGSACGPRMLQHVDRSSQGIDRPTFQSVDLPVSAFMLTFTTTDSEKPIKRRRTVRISPHSPGTAAQQVPHYYSPKPK